MTAAFFVIVLLCGIAFLLGACNLSSEAERLEEQLLARLRAEGKL